MSRHFKLLIFICVFFVHHSVFAQRIEVFPPVGIQPYVVSPQGKSTSLYRRSAALIVSVSKYPVQSTGWRPLPDTEVEMNAVRDELVRHGFEVTRVYDPTQQTLNQQMQAFLGKYGDQEDVRLLFFYSGHGYTNAVNKMSYIVPVDAGDPKTDYPNFISNSIALELFHTWVRQFKATHFMAIFDACFSGAIFTTKSSSDSTERRPLGLEDRWRYLTSVINKPVRQFISAGGADEELPALSSFVPVFIEGLKGGASSIKDGYVGGKELGIFLERVVSTRRAGKQNPHSGVSSDTNFIFGDMVFQLPDFNGGKTSDVNNVGEISNLPNQRTDWVRKVTFSNSGDDRWGMNALGKGKLLRSGSVGVIEIDRLQIRHNKKASADGYYIDDLQVLLACPDGPEGKWKHIASSTAFPIGEKVSDGKTIEREALKFTIQFNEDLPQIRECWLVLSINNGGDSLDSPRGMIPVYSQSDVFKRLD